MGSPTAAHPEFLKTKYGKYNGSSSWIFVFKKVKLMGRSANAER
jgi:hypothetical protein